jgi:hypothetical protein
MDKRQLRALRNQVSKAINVLNEVKANIDAEIGEPRPAARLRPDENIPEAQAPTDAYETLLATFREGGASAVHEFVQGKTSRFLDAFIEANSLPIEQRRSKAEVEEGLRRQLRQSLAIRE